MGRFEDFRQYAADCVRQAEAQQKPEDRDILLNVALAWVRLAQQAAHAVDDSPADESELPESRLKPSWIGTSRCPRRPRLDRQTWAVRPSARL